MTPQQFQAFLDDICKAANDTEVHGLAFIMLHTPEHHPPGCVFTRFIGHPIIMQGLHAELSEQVKFFLNHVRAKAVELGGKIEKWPPDDTDELGLGDTDEPGERTEGEEEEGQVT
jgi:hypothetical protein